MTDANPTPSEVAARWSLRRDDWGRLVLTWADGSVVEGVVPVRAFPITASAGWISLLDLDGREVLLIERPGDVVGENRRLIDAELAEREFVPVIERIVSVDSDHLPCKWTVETSRGATTFTLDSEDHLRKIGPHRVLITDSHGVRYEIPDREALDAASLKRLRNFL